MNENNVAIEVIDYVKIFKNFRSVNNINFKIKKGTIHGFIGPNGAGKTTTIKAIIGAYIPTSGKILVNNFKAGTPDANKFIGYIPERASFPKHLNALDYLITMAEFSGLKSKEAKLKGIEILKELDLFEQRKRKPSRFSSGMQKKILLAQALITNPSILILDEPAANLDPLSRFELFDTLVKLKDQGKTIFISSHILSELEKIIDEVTFLLNGEIIFSGSINFFDNQVNDLFLSTSDNNKLIELLKQNDYQCEIKENEVIIKNINYSLIQKVINFIYENNFTIFNFKTRDLQAIYNLLVEKNTNSKTSNRFIATKRSKIFAKMKNINKKIFQKLKGR